MPGFQHYVPGVPEPFYRCRPAVAGVPFPRRSNGIGWKPLSVDHERQAETVAVFAVEI